MQPRKQITRPSQRPTDPAFQYFVHFYDSSNRAGGTWLLWTDSREYAEQFAAPRRVYARQCTVQERSAWAAPRGLRFKESFVVK